MTTDGEALGEDATRTAGPSGRDRVRPSIERFARIRAAHRALPMTATELGFAESRDRVAERVRRSLQALAKPSAPEAEAHEDLETSLEGVEALLASMHADLLERVDRASFPELRATVPRAVDRRRADVLGLLDLMLEDREGVPARLTKLEYLITVLATEESEGERKIVHDPVDLTPTLALLSAEQLAGDEAETVAMLLYQAACPESGRDDLDALRTCRDRKAALGLERLSPNVLRAVVTYNARIFNRLASTQSSEQEADALLEELARDDAESGVASGGPTPGELDESDEIWQRIGAGSDDAKKDGDIVSIYEAPGIEALRGALRRRLSGTPIGSCSSERVALALDVSRLEALEREAFLSAEPEPEQSVVVAAALVGLLLRDFGAVCSDLADLGVDEETLADVWLREVEVDLAKLVTERVGDPDRYAEASALSGIKTKHLLAPLAARRERVAGESREIEQANGGLDHGADTSASADAASRPWRKRSPRPDLAGAPAASVSGWTVAGALPPRTRWALAALVLLFAVTSVNLLGGRPTTVETLDAGALAAVSPLLESAYRNDHGRGDVVIGRLDADAGWPALASERRLAAAREIVGRFESAGVREVMIYGPRGKLEIHSVAGTLRRPAP